MRNEILIGWIRNEELVLNPKGEDRNEILDWSNGDSLVVLSESRAATPGGSPSRTRGASSH